MSRMIERFLENFRKWTNTAAERAGEISKAAANKAEQLSKVGKLKLDVYQLEREQNRLLADLGRIAYEVLQGAGDESLQDLTGVEDLRRRLAGIARDIDQKTEQIERASHLDEPVHEEPPKGKPPAAKRKTAKKPAAKQVATNTTGAKTGAKKGSTKGKATSSTRKKTAPKKTTGGEQG